MSGSAARAAADSTLSSSSSACRAGNPCERRPRRLRLGIYLTPMRGSRDPMAFLLRFARQWVAGEAMDDALRVAKDANARGIDALVNHLGEHYRDKALVGRRRGSTSKFWPPCRPEESEERSASSPRNLAC